MMSPKTLAAIALLLCGCDSQQNNPPPEHMQQGLTLKNGQGIGMNGQGLGMNGPALGYPDFPTKQAHVGMAYVSLSGATTTAGAALASVHLVKGELRATFPDGVTRLTGTGFTGVLLHARGLQADGSDDTALHTVRIDGATAVVPGTPLQDTDFIHYSIKVQDGADWVDPCDGGYAIAVPGRFNYRRGPGSGGGTYTYSPGSPYFTFACQRTAIQKCAEATHYKPWQSIQGPLADSPQAATCTGPDSAQCAPKWASPLPGSDALQACTRLVRGDFCGDGTPLTQDGTLIDGIDNFPDDGIEPNTPDHPEWGAAEALWDKNGALCIDTTRVNDTINQYIEQNNCRSRAVGCTALQASFDAGTRPLLLNRSQRKMAVYLPAVPRAGAYYGRSVASYVDAPRSQVLVAVGAPDAADSSSAPSAGAGAVHVFSVSTAAGTLGARTWVTTLPAPAPLGSGARFGSAVTFRPGAAGPDLFVGASGHDGFAGALFIYPFSGWSSGTGFPAWGSPVPISGPVTGDPSWGAGLGTALATAPGGRVFVSAPSDACGGYGASGSVFYIEPGQTTLNRLLGSACPPSSSLFGATLTPVSDSELLVGATIDFACAASPGTSTGSVSLYQRQADGSWARSWKLVNPDCPPTGYMYFGSSVAVQGGKLLVSEPGATVNGQARAGQVHVFSYSTATPPSYLGALHSPAPQFNGGFGPLAAYVAAGNRLAIGETDQDVGDVGGKVHFFHEAGASYQLDKTVSDPLLVPTSASAFGQVLFTSWPAQPASPFLLIGSPRSTDDGQANAGYLFHFSFSDAYPYPN